MFVLDIEEWLQFDGARVARDLPFVPAMAVALGEGGVKTLEDLAGAATDELMGYYEVNKDKERVRVPGALDKFNLTADDANEIILDARVKAGWIEPPAEEETSSLEEESTE